MKDSKNEAYLLFLHPAARRFAVIVLSMTALFLAGCGQREIVLEHVDSRLAVQESSTDGEGSSAEENSSTEDLSPVEVSRMADEETSAGTAANSKSVMYVHVCGAVASPGVYELPEGSRIYQAVEAAGGFLENADQEWCNQAQTLHDGDSLRIYTGDETRALQEEGITPSADCFGITASVSAERIQTGMLADQAQETAPGQASAGSSQAETGKIDLNSADADQLMTIPGIGKTRAEDILSYRRTHGRFENTEELMQISGIGSGLYEKIKAYVTAL